MKILWAVDVLESHPRAVQSMRRFLKALHGRTPLTVDAVSVLRSPDRSPSGSQRKAAEKLLEARLGTARAEKWFRAEHVIFESQIPQRVAVAELIEFAQKGHYDAIVAVKHSKIGRKPAFLGSFAEMLSFLTPLPLFLVNPDGWIPAREVRRLLVATDASANCGQDFQKLARFLPLARSTVLLHHGISVPGSKQRAAADPYWRTLVQSTKDRLTKYGKVATLAGGKIEVRVKFETRTLEDAILSEASKDKSDLIVLSHRRKGVLGFFLGRITRRILQKSDRPVLLLRL